MENSKEYNKTYKGISGNELSLINLINENNLMVFGVEELHRLSSWKRSRLHNTLFSLKEKDVLVKIKRDRYALKKDLNEKLFEIATATVRPSYISFWTALSYYGFTEQQVKTIQLVSTKQQGEINFNSHHIEVTTFQPQKFYGYIRENSFVIAEKEKALVDSLYQLEKCGGFNEFMHCLKNAVGEINKKRFRDYLIRFGNKSMISRAGYILEELGLYSGNLRRYRSKSYVKLDPKKEKTKRYNEGWRIIINQKVKRREVIH